MGPLSRDDLDELSDAAATADDPSDLAARLIDAAATGRLVDPADTGYAYLLAAEIHERVEDLPQALALAERALAAYQRSGRGELAQPRSYRARLLLQLGREDEAMAELAELRPLLADDDPYERPARGHRETGGEVDAAGAGPEPELAGPDDLDESFDPDAEPDLDGLGPGEYTSDGYTSDGYTSDGYGGDGYGGDDADAVLLVWPRDAYELVDQRWPELLEPTGAESWDGYRRYCQSMIVTWSRRGRGVLFQVTGDADEFEEWLDEQGEDPYQANLVSLAQAYGEHLAEQGDPVELPPDRADPCWCGSGVRYDGCCQPLSR